MNEGLFVTGGCVTFCGMTGWQGRILTVRALRISATYWVVLTLSCASMVFAGPAEDLLNAATRDDTAAVQALLSKGANVNARDASNGKTALFVASDYGYRDVVQILLDQKASVNVKTNLGATALMAAAFKGHDDVVKLLIERHADVNAKNGSGVTALMGAAFKGDRDVVKMLLDKGANVNARADNGSTALTLTKDASIKAQLMQAGAKP